MIEIKLDQKPTSISIRYNAYYKIVILLAIIKFCGTSKKVSVSHIHIIFWSLRNENNYQVLYDLVKKRRSNLTPWTFEHGINEVLAIGYINKYIERKVVSDTLDIGITEIGESIIDTIIEKKLFQYEIDKIKSFGKISKSVLDKGNKNWALI